MTGEIRVLREGGLAWQCPFSRRELAMALDAMRTACGLAETAIDLTLAGDAFVCRVNADQMGCTGPTNILSFPPFPGPVTGAALLLLSLDTLERECMLYGQDPAEHAVRLLAHGMAHVSGLDHGPEMDAAQAAAFAAGLRALEDSA